MATNHKNLVSVVVRTHSPKKMRLLEATLQSICANPHRPIEIVLVAQTENQYFLSDIDQMIQGYRHNQVSISLVVNPTNRDERAKNLNLGIAQAQGRYLCFLDEDDLHYPNFISSLLTSLQGDPTHAWVYGDVALAICLMDKDGTAHQQSIDFPFKRENFSLDELFRGNFIPINSYLLDRDRIRPELLAFDESFNLAEDYVFLLKLAIDHKPLYVQKTVSVYQIFNDLSNSTFIMNDKKGLPDREKIRAWSHALWRIEALKEALSESYSPGLFSTKTRKYIYHKFPQLKVIIQYLMFYLRKNSRDGKS